uniref:Putative secreted protein n=1 Tax=Anopheles marajoara TaxID=58244 RepID=A0A2M4C7E2_9DIPT
MTYFAALHAELRFRGVHSICCSVALALAARMTSTAYSAYGLTHEIVDRSWTSNLFNGLPIPSMGCGGGATMRRCSGSLPRVHALQIALERYPDGDPAYSSDRFCGPNRSETAIGGLLSV